jgi:hypothetical protein
MALLEGVNSPSRVTKHDSRISRRRVSKNKMARGPWKTLLWVPVAAGLALLQLATPACTGIVGGNRNNALNSTAGPGSGVPGGERSDASPDGSMVSTALDSGPMPLRRLTKQEYLNTLRDLLGTTGFVTSDPTLPGNELEGSGYSWGATLDTNALSGLMTFAHGVAAALDVSSLLHCTAGQADRDCVSTWLDSFGLHAYRRPLSADEKSTLLSQYDSSRADLALNLNDAVSLLIETVIQSPYLLYLWELGPSAPVVDPATHLIHLNDYELASRLSYAIWETMPDDALLSAASDQELTMDDTALETQARRMLKDPKARVAIGDFHLQWLHIPDLPPARTTGTTRFDQTVFSAMRDETAAFAASVIVDGDAQLSTLLNSNVAFVNQYTAPLYGLTGITGDALQQVTLPTAERSGIFTRLAYQTINSDTAESKPPARGKYVLEQLLCSTPPPPPKSVTVLPPPDPTQTTRQRYEIHDTQPCASGCHSTFDPIGFAFENFDWIGQYRATYAGGQPVDASATLSVASLNLSGSWHDFHELGTWLAASPVAQDCIARQYFRFLVGRQESDDPDTASWNRVSAQYVAENRDLRELIVAIVTSPAFVYRQLNPGEVAP